MIRSSRLSLRFDPVRLQADLQRLEADHWVPHFNSRDYEGAWAVLGLRGSADATHPIQFVHPDPNARRFRNAPGLSRCTYFPEVLSAFGEGLRHARLLRLGPGSEILEHRDNGLSLEDGAVRLHIPVQTNPGVDFRLNGRSVHMREGECWYLRLVDPHAVSNRGTTDRVHLVVDCEPSDWLRTLIERGKVWSGTHSDNRRAMVPESRCHRDDAEQRLAHGYDGAFDRAISEKIVAFLREIGLKVDYRAIDEATVIPGIAIHQGRLIVDESRLTHPGDLLHEAGHLAVVSAAKRASLGGSLKISAGQEMAAIAWSYAAALHLEIDPKIVFHEHGYKGDAAHILENFEAGRTFGVPMLAWLGMTQNPTPGSRSPDCYPRMKLWTCERLPD